jgi:hypothetical protein
MSDVEFNEGNININTRANYSSGGMTGFLLRKGWVKSQTQAVVVLIVFSIVCISLAIWIGTIPARQEKARKAADAQDSLKPNPKNELNLH